MRHPRPPAQRKLGLGVAALAFVVVTLASVLGSLEGLESSLIDLRFRLRGARPVSRDIVLLAIDDESLQSDHLGPWPWPPDRLAEAVRALKEADASVIGLDLIELTRPQPGRKSGEAGLAHLADAIADAGNVVLPMYFEGVPATPAPGASSGGPLEPFLGQYGGGDRERMARARWSGPCMPAETLIESAAGVGSINVVLDLDGVVRAMPIALDWQGRPYPSFAAEIVRVFSHLDPGAMRVYGDRAATIGDAPVPLREGGEMLLNYYGGYGAFPSVPFHLAVGERADAEALARAVRGRIVIVGKTAAKIEEKSRTPLHPYVPGAELQATAVSNILRGHFFSEPPRPLVLLLALILACLTGFVCSARGPGGAAVLFVVVLAGTSFLFAMLFFAGVCIRAAEPLSTITLTGLIVLALRAAAADRSRAKAQSAMDTLTAVGRIVRSTLNRPELLHSILLWVQDELQAEACSLLTRDDETGDLIFEIALGEKAEEVKAFRLRRGEGIAGYTAEVGRTLLVPDVARDDRFRRDIADAIDFPTQSILCTPLKVQDRVVGVIEVINKRGGGAFTADDVELLESIAGQAAVFIENVKLYQVLEQRVDFANRELIATNRELLSEKSKVEAIVQSMADGVITVDLGQRVLHMNSAAEKILGIELNDVMDKPVGHCPFDDELRALLGEKLGSGDDEWETEVALTWPAPAVVRVQAAPVRSEGATVGYVAVLTDITQLKQLDRMKTEFVSLASHELKSPLTAIKGFVALLGRAAGEDPDDPNAQFIRIIDRQVDRMRRIIDDFLNIARLEARRPLEMNWQVIADLPNIVNEIVETERSSDDIHRFDVDLPPDLPAVEADRDKLYQVIANLINNAVKYSPNGGTITVKGHEENGEVVFAVSDEGLGIAPDQINQIFQRFRRVTTGGAERVTGTGLGLYLSRNIIEAHGGRIWVESRPGEGSTFSFAVPVRRPETPRTEDD